MRNQFVGAGEVPWNPLDGLGHVHLSFRVFVFSHELDVLDETLHSVLLRQHSMARVPERMIIQPIPFISIDSGHSHTPHTLHHTIPFSKPITLLFHSFIQRLGVHG